MSTLTDNELRKIRNYLEQVAASNNVPVSYVKVAINDTAQAFETWLMNNQAAAAAVMQGAAAPHGVSWSNADLKQISAIIFKLKFDRDRSVL